MLPDVSEEDPECSGVEQQPGYEEYQVEVGVYHVHFLIPDRFVVVAFSHIGDHISFSLTVTPMI